MISSYALNAHLLDMQISGGTLSGPEYLAASYMLPFVLDTPPSWSFTYYDATAAGYRQIAGTERTWPVTFGPPEARSRDGPGSLMLPWRASGSRILQPTAPSGVVTSPPSRARSRNEPTARDET